MRHVQGQSLDDDGIFSIVKCVLDAKALPWDPKGWYVVLSSAEIKETSGFCSKYCGWHAHDDWLGKNVRSAPATSPVLCPPLPPCHPTSSFTSPPRLFHYFLCVFLSFPLNISSWHPQIPQLHSKSCCRCCACDAEAAQFSLSYYASPLSSLLGFIPPQTCFASGSCWFKARGTIMARLRA